MFQPVGVIAMVKQSVRFSSPAVKQVQYERFRGVDVTSDAMLIDRSRLAVGLNLISDYNGLPERRLGFRTLHTFDGAVNGIFYCDFGSALETDHIQYLVHAGDSIYKYNIADSTATLLMAEVGITDLLGFGLMASNIF